MQLLKLFLIPISFLVVFSHAFAGNLVVQPTRIVFDKDAKSAQVDITNTGSETATYRISFENKRMTEKGDFLPVVTPLPDELFADKMLQFSPRQVVLGPGAGQTVRVLLRKPADLGPGEYRSHLTFSELPNPKAIKPSGDNTSKDEIGIKLSALVGISIPVIVRQGVTSVKTSLTDLKFNNATKKEAAALSLNIKREGNQSSYGDLSINVISPNGSEEKIGGASGVAVYYPNALRFVKVVMRTDTDLAHRKLHVTYREQSEAGGKLLSEAELQLP